jgi:hypothetical protein
LFVFESYKDEIIDRKLSTDCFPRTSLQKLIGTGLSIGVRPKIARRMNPRRGVKFGPSYGDAAARREPRCTIRVICRQV